MKQHIFLALLVFNSLNAVSAEMPSVKEYKENWETNKYDQFLI